MLGGTGPSQSYFDPTAFRSGHRGPLRDQRPEYHYAGPGLPAFDLGLFRQFSVTERLKMQFRAEAFNATNTPHFNNPGTNVSNAVRNADGTCQQAERLYGNPAAQTDQRQLRLGLRLSF